MSDDEFSDDMQELNDLIAEYKAKDENEDTAQQEDVDDTAKSTEVPMDKVLFGDKNKLIKNLQKAVEKKKTKKQQPETIEDTSDSDKEEKDDGKRGKKRKPVWIDSDDEALQLGDVKKETNRTGPLNHLQNDKSYKEYLQSKFTRIVNQPKWANIDEAQKKEASDDEDEQLLRTVGFLSKTPASILQPSHLEFKRMKDLNRSTYGEGYINSIEFHPTSTAALVAGDKGVASIYAIDGVENEKLHNIHIPNFPIKCAKILPCGTRAMFGSVTRWVYSYDLMAAKETCFKLKRDNGDLSKFEISPCGRYLVSAGLCGEFHLFEAKSFEVIRTFKQNDDIAAMTFTADSQNLIVSGRSSNVNIFSMRQQRLQKSFIDDGCIVGSAMDLSPNQRLLATASMEGVVNVYDFQKVMQSNSTLPEKTFFNLTTSIGKVKFNHTSELLAFASFRGHHALRIAHFPSATVYDNFPGKNPKLGHVRTLAFSPHSSYLALGSTRECPLYRLKHFENY